MAELSRKHYKVADLPSWIFEISYYGHVSMWFFFLTSNFGDSMALRYSQKLIFNMVSVSHIGLVVMSLYCIWEVYFYVPDITLNFWVYWFSTFWYTWTFIFEHFDLKLLFLGQILTFFGCNGAKFKNLIFWFPKGTPLHDSASFKPLCDKIRQWVWSLSMLEKEMK